MPVGETVLDQESIKANLVPASRVHHGRFHEEHIGGVVVVGFGKFVQQLNPPLQYLCFCEGLNEMYCCSCTFQHLQQPI
jgi:hypothetical protein